ncbi:hypothetical protein PSN45_000427 [Yamadazyma tenuis]|uniref:Uncharacterized protein n=1 Tax=Candida tenuis (strain ATCC 10573 / BCRC 21748 / CBS 615 / JCM 9827 / NBRC 10315 / NRRL Y-1498 / VKM Y-70) TaxID=590646 RepID=G3B8I5_CANTC|nr:uncharacterized protein CANTEDRAFT_109466 [Yamadazyma tenuis ATCC 10573]EGV61739.1 hypothetical protein CANTEDRAFT_109466 [Yamadazyma tenuis ATCC 10573]WEJ92969.1 hypothetical protein PSN45_000427 [Yamadazyma tenuis]
MFNSWFVEDNQGKIVSYDVKSLRRLGRDQAFCNSVSESQLDKVFDVLFNYETGLDQKVEIIATISNIVLVNRHLHMTYFIPRYSKRSFVYCDKLIKQFEAEKSDFRYDFASLVPIYRILFLTLYGGLEQICDAIINDVFGILLDGFKCYVAIMDDHSNVPMFQLLVVEILKCLYTLHHKYHSGSELVQDEGFSDDCLKIINQFVGVRHTENGHLIIKNTLNFLLLLHGEREESKSIDLYTGSIELYLEFFKNLDVLLKEHLETIKREPGKSIVACGFAVNMLVVLDHMASSLKRDVEQNPESAKFNQLLTELASLILPSDGSKFVYNEFIQYVATMIFSGADGSSFFDLKNAGFTKDLILSILYSLTYDKDIVKHQNNFLELVGYVFGHKYLENHSIVLDPSIDIKSVQEPTSKYLDTDDYNRKRAGVFGNIPADQSGGGSVDDLTEEEKEREAEKLFVLFERMEKLGTFENFQNPVKQWQQEGKFEELKE